MEAYHLVGPFNAGKTTIFEKVGNEGFRKVPEMARLILERNDYFKGNVKKCQEAGRYEEFQWRVAELHRMAEVAYDGSPTIHDSGTICAYAYAAFCEEPTMFIVRDRIARHLDKFVPKKAIFLDPLPIVDDGLRHTDRDDQAFVAKEILDCCKKFGILVARIRAMPVPERIKEVEKQLK